MNGRRFETPRSLLATEHESTRHRLAALPESPGELRYRFVGQDLLFVDIDANIIVDVLPDAFPLTFD